MSCSLKPSIKVYINNRSIAGIVVISVIIAVNYIYFFTIVEVAGHFSK